MVCLSVLRVINQSVSDPVRLGDGSSRGAHCTGGVGRVGQPLTFFTLRGETIPLELTLTGPAI